MEIKTVAIKNPDNMNMILGQSHFIKTVEDIYEAMVSTVPMAKFGLAFCEASDVCLVRHTGTDDEMRELAVDGDTRGWDRADGIIVAGFEFFRANTDFVRILRREFIEG